MEMGLAGSFFKGAWSLNLQDLSWCNRIHANKLEEPGMQESAWIKDVTLDNFQTDVIERSLTVPAGGYRCLGVLVCAVHKQLMPLLEKLGTNMMGIELVKVNADEQQQLAGTVGSSEPANRISLARGRLKDHFTGALPESEVTQMVLANM